MPRLLWLIWLLPVLASGQAAKPLAKAQLTELYSQVIADFIVVTSKEQKARFDTLFIGKRNNHQPDDFPEIELPQTIAATQIKLITPEAGKKSQEEWPARVYINLMGWIHAHSATFLFVVFSQGFRHQYDYSLEYRYNSNRSEWKLTHVQFKRP